MEFCIRMQQLKGGHLFKDLICVASTFLKYFGCS